MARSAQALAEAEGRTAAFVPMAVQVTRRGLCSDLQVGVRWRDEAADIVA